MHGKAIPYPSTTTFTSIWKAPDAQPLRFKAGDKVVALVVNTVSAGVAGVVVEGVNALTKRGAAVYMLATVKALLGYRPVRCRVDIDGATAYEGPIFLLAVANGVTFGKGMKIAPKAKVDDGLADVVVVGDVPRWQLPFRLPQVFLGYHLDARPVIFRQARTVRCEPIGPFTAYELDGDVGPPGPMEMRVLPGAARLALGRPWAPGFRRALERSRHRGRIR